MTIPAVNSDFNIAIPQGRLSLQAASPVPTVDTANATTIYYSNYRGNLVPYFDGTTDQYDKITSGQVSNVLQASSTGVVNANDGFDLWWIHNGGTPKLVVATNGSGGGWASDTGGSVTARGTGYTQLDKTTRPYITNANTLTHAYNGSTDFGPIPANQATYLGSFYTTAAGQTGMRIGTLGTNGGIANVGFFLYNAYNQEPVYVINADTLAVSTSSTTWVLRSANNKIQWFDGLQTSFVDATFIDGYSTSANGPHFAIGVDGATPANNSGYGQGQANGTPQIGDTVKAVVTPQLGLHTVEMLIMTTSGTTSDSGGGTVGGVTTTHTYLIANARM